ncbi:MAG TPA: thiamine pyrophosphate-binding protein [Candidatus Sulfotelmatobacter sp.]|jgi:acetolactate synthase-1/2/3 large subunit|nr:thiamine pyrophosphate-binding protein [Candidatus Sulfotelmatobacter sp.]
MKKIKLSDYITKFLEEKGITHAFILGGGGNMHIIDSIGKSKIAYVCNRHEQASAMGAEGYANITGKPGVCVVTTGPGGTNTMTGVLDCWLDSIPMIVLSGQIARRFMGAGTKMGVRQLGVQELNIVDVVKPMTKYAVAVMDFLDIRYELEKAWYLATTGRQGPVWLDIPLDVQNAMIDEEELRKFDPAEVAPDYIIDKKTIQKLVEQTLKKLSESERPVLYAGHGIRLSGAYEEFLELIDLLKIPVLTSYVGYDMVPSDHPYFFGRAHAMGQRAGNFILQNSDLLFSLGARLDILTIGYEHEKFARAAYKIMVDIDKHEIEKPTLAIDLPINTDAKLFIQEMIKQLKEKSLKLKIDPWLVYGRKLNKKYPNVPKEFWNEKKFVNPYCFIEESCKQFKPGEVVVLANGVNVLNCSYQAFIVKKGQRVILNLGSATMGYGIAVAIGVSFALGNKKRVICMEGDGSIQMNIQELETIKYYNLPIKLFIHSNDGYLSNKGTQKNLFGGRYVGSGKDSGISCPDYVKVGKAYGIKSIRIKNHKEMKEKIKYVLDYPGPIICDISALKEMSLTPKLLTKKRADGSFYSPPLEDMAPFLSKEELKENMIIPLFDEE